MTGPRRVIYLLSTDVALTELLLAELMAAAPHYQLPIAPSVQQARRCFERAAPSVILLDESAIGSSGPTPSVPGSALKSAVAELTEFAPVVVIAVPERQADLTFLITSGAVDFVARVGDFLPVAVGLLERRIRLAEQAVLVPGSAYAADDPDFGEVLRHEVNNPLTGILGNAELLLAEFRKTNGSGPSEASVERLQTIAQLAVRLRETVRRISDSWESRHDHVRSA